MCVCVCVCVSACVTQEEEMLTQSKTDRKSGGQKHSPTVHDGKSSGKSDREKKNNSGDRDKDKDRDKDRERDRDRDREKDSDRNGNIASVNGSAVSIPDTS